MSFLGRIFSPSPPRETILTPPPPPPPVAPTDQAAEEAAQQAAEKQRQAAALAQGRQSTLLTGGLGDTNKAPVNRRTLFGEGGYAYAA
jgi:hypothetical protein